MNVEKIEKAKESLDKAIARIDNLLEKYPIVMQMELAKKARLGLELSSRLIDAGLNGANQVAECIVNSEGSDNIESQDDNLGEPDIITNERNEKPDETEEGGE